MSDRADGAAVVEESAPGTKLARKLRTLEYFTLAFGSMVGAGWLIIIDDWLTRGGPLGGILGFLAGALLLVPIGLTYGRLVAGLPDAGGEVAYTERVFPRAVSFVTGWFVVLAYLVVCPWEAVAIGKLLARVAPVLDSVELYSFGGQPVFLYRLLVGLAVTAFICYLNYRGIHSSARFQNVCTFGLLAVFATFSALGFIQGSVRNLTPLFSHPGVGGSLVSVLLILQIVPYFMTGFEAVAKSSEEASADFHPTGFRNAILLAIGVGGIFYATVMLVVPMVHPWTELTAVPFGTAIAFERAFGSRALGDFILLGAVLSLFKVFNGCFIAATRMVYGMGKRGLVHSRLASVHRRFQTPHLAIAFVGLVTVVATFLGDALLVPISELGSLAIAVGWLAACVCFLKGVSWSHSRTPGRGPLLMAWLGALVALLLVSMKLLPFVPGHMSWPQYVGLFVWMALGLGLSWVGGGAGHPRRTGEYPART
jgi:amino acid transporter